MTSSESPFFEIPIAAWIDSNRSAFAVWDAFPVSAGHALVVTRRPLSTWWEATPEERTDVFELVDAVRARVTELHHPDGFNVGFNSGTVAGQTVDHLHIHVIPRYTGDVPDPRGGIRNVIPSRGNYLAPSSDHVLIDGQVQRLRDVLVRYIRDSRFDRIDIVVSFIRLSGLTLLLDALGDAISRGVSIRILTTDYMGITEPAALSRLLDLIETNPDSLAVRVFRDQDVSFHPKSYMFWSSASAQAVAFVGSSNISGPGLDGGIEWNLLVDGVTGLRHHFRALWDDPRSLLLSNDVIHSYVPAERHRPAAIELSDIPIEIPEPRPIQCEALEALEQSRASGFKAGLVVMATGLGKTWLAAFDAIRPEFGRVLFVAHRDEILQQSREVFRRIAPNATMGMFLGGEKQPHTKFVFAGVQTLSRHLDIFPANAFDYIVVDEFHHAAAASYRMVIDHFTPRFLLGLTATPERTDGADLLALCGEHVAFECDFVEGIRRQELVPFHYWGVPDPVDFEPIPWRGGRFDPAALEAAVETQDRAQAAFDQWNARRGERTLVFCVTQHHADFMADFFRNGGVRCASVHSGPTSAPRHQSIDELRSGEIEVIFSVDIFNEGLDVPDIDTVMMLRPTESPIVFLQQLGRGLRTSVDKDALTVIDFIGNHRSFLLKPRTLLSLTTSTAPTTLQVLQAIRDGDFDLPDGCSVDYELEVVDMFTRLAKFNSRDAIEDYCRSYFEEEGLRPTATQALRAGHDPAIVRPRFRGWFEFLDSIKLLTSSESAVRDEQRNVLSKLETEPINKSHKLVALRALLHDGRLRSGDEIAHNAETSRRLILADPRLERDVPAREFPELAESNPEKWAAYWLKWPLKHMASEGEAQRADPLFRIADDRIVPTYAVSSELALVFDAMAAEIIEYRLAHYLASKATETETWSCNLTIADGLPVVRLDRRQSPDLPTGTILFEADGEQYSGEFDRGALVNAAPTVGPGNTLADLLRSWFGPSAGHPGTRHVVILEHSRDGYTLRPAAQPADQEVDYVPLLASFDVACRRDAHAKHREHTAPELPVRRRSGELLDPSSYFVCFADADSEVSTVQRGDPLLFEWIDDGTERDYLGTPVLIKTSHQSRATGALTVLTSETIGQKPVARLVDTLGQADINPLSDHVGDTFKRADIPPLYGLRYNPGNWQSGHVSFPGGAVLLVTLQKRSDTTQYVDHFEGPDTFVWSSQLSTAPDGKKGREILESLETGTSIELWLRKRREDLFSYLGRVVPLEHRGSKPMSVTFRLLTPLSGELQSRFGT